jgi:hypothetical protein
MFTNCGWVLENSKKVHVSVSASPPLLPREWYVPLVMAHVCMDRRQSHVMAWSPWLANCAAVGRGGQNRFL